MTTRLEVIAFLVEDARKEEELLDAYKRAEDAAEKTAQQEQKKTGSYVSCYRYLNWGGQIPHKSTVAQKLKLVRQLCLQEMKEL